MLQIDNTVLLIIDIQDRLFENTERILRAAKVLGLEVICTEQYPDGLGATVPQIAEHVDVEPISKLAFSCCGEEAFQTALKQTGRKQVLIAGIETHICVYQTTMDLLADGYQVYVLTDAVSSRTKANRKLGLERMKEAGVMHTSVEMALFEMLKIAKGDQFKEIARIVK